MFGLHGCRPQIRRLPFRPPLYPLPLPPLSRTVRLALSATYLPTPKTPNNSFMKALHMYKSRTDRILHEAYKKRMVATPPLLFPTAPTKTTTPTIANNPNMPSIRNNPLLPLIPLKSLNRPTYYTMCTTRDREGPRLYSSVRP